MKLIITENKRDKIAIKWLNDNYGDLESFKTKIKPSYIFYRKNGEVIFDYNKKDGVVFVNYKKIWSFLESFFGMDFHQIRDLIIKWVKEHYNLRVTSTMIFY